MKRDLLALTFITQHCIDNEEKLYDIFDESYEAFLDYHRLLDNSELDISYVKDIIFKNQLGNNLKKKFVLIFTTIEYANIFYEKLLKQLKKNPSRLLKWEKEKECIIAYFS